MAPVTMGHLAPAVMIAPPPPLPTPVIPVAVAAPAPRVERVAPRRERTSRDNGGGGDRCEGITVSVDAGRREIALRLSYVSAGICVTAVVVLLGLSYLFGTQRSGGTRTVISKDTTAAIKAGPVVPSLLARSTTPAGVGRDAAGSGTAARAPVGNAGGAARPAGGTSDARTPAPAGVDGVKRTANLNYLVVQSYPNKEMAEEAVEVLRKEGIGATVEKGLRGWAPRWFTVVGTKGFARTRDVPEYQEYVKKVVAISTKRHAQQKSFTAFMPLPYQWGL